MNNFFQEHLKLIAESDEGANRLRASIIDFAVKGQLVDQDNNDQSASTALDAARKKLGSYQKHWKPLPKNRTAKPEWEVPSNWVETTINDTGRYINGLGFKKADWRDEGQPIIRIQNLTNPSASFNYVEGDFEDVNTVEDGDLLVSWSATLDAFIWDRGAAVVNQHIFKVEPEECLVHRGFLFLLLKHSIKALAAGDRTRGVAMKHLKRGDFLSYPIAIPPLEEQKRIVAKVDELLALINDLEDKQKRRETVRVKFRDAALSALVDDGNAEERKESFERLRNNWAQLLCVVEDVSKLRQSVFDLAVAGRFSIANQSSAIADSLFEILSGRRPHPIFRDPESESTDINLQTFQLPEGWEWIELQDLISEDRGISYGVIKLGAEPSQGGVSVLRCSDVKKGHLVLNNVRKVSPEIEEKYARTRLKGGEVVLNIRGTLGGVAKVPEELAGFNVAREVAVIPVYKEISSDYIVTVMSSSYFWNGITSSLRGIAYKGLNLGLLRKFLIPIPPVQEQESIVETVNCLMKCCDSLEEQLEGKELLGNRLAEAIAATA